MTISFRALGALATLALAVALSGNARAADTLTITSPAVSSKLASSAATPPTGAVKPVLPFVTSAIGAALEKAAAPSNTGGGVAGAYGTKNGLSSLAYGGSGVPYTTARVAVTSLGSSTSTINTPVTSYPYRAAGKLFFKIGTGNYVCSASLVTKGVLITAAHCVYNYGANSTKGWYSNWVWCPANTGNGTGVYGCYNGVSARIPTAYYNGTDTCYQRGVVCNNDLATITLAPKSGVYAGTKVGWYSYGWNNYGFLTSSFYNNLSVGQLTQLGYPVALDYGYQMIRTEALGRYTLMGSTKVNMIGSAQTGGSSGGPWLANFGTVPAVTGGASLGNQSVRNVVVGVTSFGYTAVGYNLMGASFFGQNTQFPLAAYGTYGAGNIGAMMRDTCTANAAYC